MTQLDCVLMFLLVSAILLNAPATMVTVIER